MMILANSLSARTFLTSHQSDIDTLFDTVRVNVCFAHEYNDHGFTLTDFETSSLGAELVRTRLYNDDKGIPHSLTLIATVVPNPRAIITGDTRICQGGNTTLTVTGGDTYQWNDGTLDASLVVGTAGTYRVKSYNTYGCVDSATHTVSVSAPIMNESTVHLCEGDSALFIDEYKKEAGRYSRWLKTPKGCDSLYAIYVEVHPNPTVVITGDLQYCEGASASLTATGADTYRWQDNVRGNTYPLRATGQYFVEGTTSWGCTGTDTVQVTQHPIYTTSYSQEICNGQSYPFYQRQLRASGTYTFTDHSIHNCDSVVAVSLTVHPLSNIAITVYATNSYRWADSTYYLWGDYHRIFPDIHGCDSHVTLHLGILPDNTLPHILTYNNRLLIVDHYPGGTDSARVDYMAYRWARNGQYIASATSDQYALPSQTTLQGCYRVEVQVDSIHWIPSNVICIDDDYTFNAIDSYESLNGYTLSPNPAKSGQPIAINAVGSGHPTHYTIVTPLGQTIRHTSLDSAKTITAPSIPGLYIIKIHFLSGPSFTQKLIVR